MIGWCVGDDDDVDAMGRNVSEIFTVHLGGFCRVGGDQVVAQSADAAFVPDAQREIAGVQRGEEGEESKEEREKR